MGRRIASNVLATAALFATLTGTAAAATMLNGAKLPNATLTGTNFAKRTIGDQSFSSAAESKLMGAKGAKGDQGLPGVPGDPGAQGMRGQQGSGGKPGTAAPRAFTFVGGSDPGRIAGADVNPPTFGPVYSGPAGTAPYYPTWSNECANGNHYCHLNLTITPLLDETYQTVLQTSQQANGGTLSVPHSGNLVVDANVTLMHPTSGAPDDTAPNTMNTRAECKIQASNVNSSDGPFDVGGSVFASSVVDSQLIPMLITGGVHVDAGTYDMRVVCRDPDEDGSAGDRWEFINGNIRVLTTAY